MVGSCTAHKPSTAAAGEVTPDHTVGDRRQRINAVHPPADAVAAGRLRGVAADLDLRTPRTTECNGYPPADVRPVADDPHIGQRQVDLAGHADGLDPAAPAVGEAALVGRIVGHAHVS